MVNYSLESLGQSFRSGNHPTEMELELEMASIRDGMSELGAYSDMLDRAFNSAELAMNIIKNFKDEDQCLELLKCQATMESLINVNGGTINDLTVSAAQEGIKEFFKTIWEKIKAFFAKLWDYIKRFFTWLGEKMGLIKNKNANTKERLKKANPKKVEAVLKKKRDNKGASTEDVNGWTEKGVMIAHVFNVPKSTLVRMANVLSNLIEHDADVLRKNLERVIVPASEVQNNLKLAVKGESTGEFKAKIEQAIKDLQDELERRKGAQIDDSINSILKSVGLRLISAGDKSGNPRIELTSPIHGDTHSLWNLGYQKVGDLVEVVEQLDDIVTKHQTISRKYNKEDTYYSQLLTATNWAIDLDEDKLSGEAKTVVYTVFKYVRTFGEVVRLTCSKLAYIDKLVLEQVDRLSNDLSHIISEAYK